MSHTQAFQYPEKSVPFDPEYEFIEVKAGETGIFRLENRRLPKRIRIENLQVSLGSLSKALGYPLESNEYFFPLFHTYIRFKSPIDGKFYEKCLFPDTLIASLNNALEIVENIYKDGVFEYLKKTYSLRPFGMQPNEEVYESDIMNYQMAFDNLAELLFTDFDESLFLDTSFYDSSRGENSDDLERIKIFDSEVRREYINLRTTWAKLATDGPLKILSALPELERILKGKIVSMGRYDVTKDLGKKHNNYKLYELKLAFKREQKKKVELAGGYGNIDFSNEPPDENSEITRELDSAENQIEELKKRLEEMEEIAFLRSQVNTLQIKLTESLKQEEVYRERLQAISAIIAQAKV